MSKIKELGGKIEYPVKLPSMEDLQYEGKSAIYTTSCKSNPFRTNPYATANPEIQSM